MSHTIIQVKSFPIGTVIPRVEGTIEKVFPVKTGEGQYGPWKLQSFVMNDGTGEKIKATLFDSDDISYLQGKHAVLISTGTNGKTKKQQGVELVANKQDGSPELSIKGKSGGIVTGDQPNPAYMRGSPENKAANASSTPVSLRSGPITPLQGSDGSEGPVDALNRLACFWLACWHKASLVEGLPAETKQSMASCLFIEGNKQGLARAWPMEAPKAKATPAPAPAEAVDSDNPF